MASARAQFDFMAACVQVFDDTVGPLMVKAAADASPVGHGDNPGTLRDSWYPVRHVSAREATIELHTNSDHYKYVRYGRGPVRPVRARVLHWRYDGADVFSMYSGPTQPNNFIPPAMEGIKSDIEAAIRAAVKVNVKLTLG